MNYLKYDESCVSNLIQTCENCKNSIINGFDGFEQSNSIIRNSCNSSAVEHVINQVYSIKTVYMENVTNQLFNIQSYLGNYVVDNFNQNELVNLKNSNTFDVNSKQSNNKERFE